MTLVYARRPIFRAFCWLLVFILSAPLIWWDRSCWWMLDQWRQRDEMTPPPDPVARVAFVLAGVSLAGTATQAELKRALPPADRRHFKAGWEFAIKAGWVRQEDNRRLRAS